METTTNNNLSDQLKIYPWQIEVSGKIIMARKSGHSWPYGTRHYLYSIQRVGFGPSEIFYFEYSQVPAHTKAPSLADLMYALLEDARAIESCYDVWDMAKEYGYEINSKESYRNLQDMYQACEDVHYWLNKTFSSEELVQLYKLFEDY